jgi:hypothetical protein
MKMTRELKIADLDLVIGGMDPNYKFCWDGPAGSGTYPNYVDCGGGGGAVGALIKAFQDGVRKGLGGKPS